MYVPILKNRTVEVSVIKRALQSGISNSISPLIEVVQEKSRANLSMDSFSDEIGAIFRDTDTKFFVDIINRPVTKKVKSQVQKFITQNNRDSEFTLKCLLKCSELNNCVPVLSYDEIEFLDGERIKRDAEVLRNTFEGIAVRLVPAQFNGVYNELFEVLGEGDYLLFDIQKNKYTEPKFRVLFNKIKEAKKIKNFQSILLIDSKPVDYYNVGVVDGQLIEEIDVSYLENYKKEDYGNFDGIADYVGINSSLPTDGGALSPAGIYYSKKDNQFVGYRYREGKRVASEFTNHIAPEIMQSEFWKQYDETHHNRCEGCITIAGVIDGTVKGGNQAAWKGVTMAHYIHTLNEFRV